MLPSGPFEPFTFHVRRAMAAPRSDSGLRPACHAERCARVMLYLIGIQARNAGS